MCYTGPGHTNPFMAVLYFIGRLFLCAFFTVHYGAFMLVHGAFICVFSTAFVGRNLQVSWPYALGMLEHVKWAVGALFLSHLWSFFSNYLYGGEYKIGKAGDLMRAPYFRVSVMHSTIIIGAFAMLVFHGGQTALLAVFVLMKTMSDLSSHLRERDKFSTPASPVSRA